MPGKTTEKVENAGPVGGGFDYAKFLPAELKGLASELRTTGGLIPMYVPRLALDNKEEEPVVGYLDRLVYLPTIEQGTESFTPLMAQIYLEAPFANARQKIGEDQYEKVPLEKGDAIYVPVSSNLQYNKDFMLAACDREKATFVMVRVKGERKVNKMPSKMLEIDVVMAGKPPKAIARTGKFAHPLDVILSIGAGKEPIAQLPSGDIVNRDTGEIKNKIVDAQHAS